jgi:ADP-ribose pyrophosphatase YjhB (NUDIX family)
LVNRREDIDACARREVREEIGLSIELVSEPAVVIDPRPQRVDVVFRARPAGGVDPGSARPRSPEVTDVGWFAADALPELQPEAASALEALARLDGKGPRTSRRTLSASARRRGGDAEPNRDAAAW